MTLRRRSRARIAEAAATLAGLGRGGLPPCFRPSRTPGERALPLRLRDATAAERSWLALDAGGATPVDERQAIRDAVSIAALCELAEEVAAGGDLDELRSQARRAPRHREPRGDRRGRGGACSSSSACSARRPRWRRRPASTRSALATRRLELALGGALQGSPFADAMRGAGDVVDALTGDVEARLPGAPPLSSSHGRRLGTSRSAATRRICSAGSRSSRRSRPSRCRRRSASSSRR